MRKNDHNIYHNKYSKMISIAIFKFQNSKKSNDQVQINLKKCILVVQLILDTMNPNIFDSLGN